MSNTIIKTTLGLAEGVQEKEYRRWFGIPYAMAPVGERRFKRAIPGEGWEGIRFFDRMGPKPVQMAGGKFGEMTASKNRDSEDCLTINVWAPLKPEAAATKLPAATQKKHPVFVWIYGGGHHAGEASIPEYDLGSFARNGVVGVSFNYRLGVLGFYDFSELDPSFESNCGISDMIMALRWIHDNIAFFGGDPDRVTLCGESAGGSAIMALLGSPVARPYFSQAIIMSGVLSNTSGKRMQRINNARFLKTVGVEPSEVYKLREMPVEQLQKGCETFFADPEIDAPGIMANGPVVDDLVTMLPLEAIQSGLVSDKLLMFGTCLEEGNLFSHMQICPMDWADVEKMLRLNGYEELIGEFHRIYDDASERRAVTAVNRDRMFWADTMKCALAQSCYCKTFVYRFDYETPISRVTKLGATHTMDVCPVLNTTEGRNYLLYKSFFRGKTRTLFREMHSAVLSFVKLGNPSGGILGTWPAFEEQQKSTMVFSERSGVSTDCFDQKRYKLWEKISLYSGD